MAVEPDQVMIFLAEAKRLDGRRMRWKPKGLRGDYSFFNAVVVVESAVLDAGMLHMTAHINRIPRKYGFNLRWRGGDVLRLDVNPARTHMNTRTKAIVRGTHWQQHPLFDADPDAREMIHLQWMDAFLRRANIQGGRLSYAPPPFEHVQFELGL